MFERYTERARRVIFFARYEASQYGAMTIESEHMLLGLLREDPALLNLPGHLPESLQAIRRDIDERSTVKEKTSTSINLPLSEECQQSLSYAVEESDRLRQRWVGTDHLLLGLLRVEACTASKILQKHKVDIGAVRLRAMEKKFEIIGIEPEPATIEKQHDFPHVTGAEEVINALDRAPRIIIPMVHQAIPELLKRRPKSGKWSIHEHACHLARVHPLFLSRLDLMLSEDNPVIRSYDPGRDDPPDALMQVDLNQALERYDRERGVLVERLRQLRKDDWTRPARHDEYNRYTVFIMFRHLALHDFFHAYRIEELLLSKG